MTIYFKENSINVTTPYPNSGKVAFYFKLREELLCCGYDINDISLFLNDIGNDETKLDADKINQHLKNLNPREILNAIARVSYKIVDEKVPFSSLNADDNYWENLFHPNFKEWIYENQFNLKSVLLPSFLTVLELHEEKPKLYGEYFKKDIANTLINTLENLFSPQTAPKENSAHEKEYFLNDLKFLMTGLNKFSIKDQMSIINEIKNSYEYPMINNKLCYEHDLKSVKLIVKILKQNKLFDETLNKLIQEHIKSCPNNGRGKLHQFNITFNLLSVYNPKLFIASSTKFLNYVLNSKKLEYDFELNLENKEKLINLLKEINPISYERNLIVYPKIKGSKNKI